MALTNSIDRTPLFNHQRRKEEAPSFEDDSNKKKILEVNFEAGLGSSRRLEEKIEPLRFKRLPVRLSPVHNQISDNTVI